MEQELIPIQNELTNEEIKNLIYTIRGKQVMLDSDVARLFEYSTKDLNRNVKNNKSRFPENYCFQLTDEEYKSLRCKNFTLNENKRGQHRKYLPYVFTEYGITMLAGLLKSEVAVNISIKIVNAFVEMRKFLIFNGQIFDRMTNIEFKLLEHDKKFEKVFNYLQLEKNIKQKIFFEGQIYDAYSLIIDIIKRANQKILIIDLGEEIYSIFNDLYNKQVEILLEKYKNIFSLPVKDAKQFISDFEYVRKINKELSKMKKGSVALLNQITTISKQRIYDDDILKKVKLSKNSLDLLDKKIIKMFTK